MGRSEATSRSETAKVTYRLEVRSDALADIEEAAQWYDQREVSLGAEFLSEVLQGIDVVLTNPLAYRVRHRRKNVRWKLLDRFPYRVVYQIARDLVTVFAVLHSARHDRQWQNRS